MIEKERIEERLLLGEEAEEFEEEVTRLVERWKYLLKLPWDIEVFAVTHTVQLTGFEEAVIHMEDDSKAKLEITVDDRHPYELEKLVVHELLHLPFMKLEYGLFQYLSKTATGREIQDMIVSNGLLPSDEALIDYWAETLVCLAHGFYPSYHNPPEDSFFDWNCRLPLDLRIHRDENGEYKSQSLEVPMSEMPQIYDKCGMSMSGLL